ncbi:uroporphyrinogen-III synthase [Cellulomonas fimi]|uniref:Uroporphyrinogen-III synthase n=1 Tax=Cellulomonas fimi TaxID=1708 RepID=A0A7Y0M070_CELFI|nr:uroporphyrinogen-III synthase [Cellulomonas fimi]NMR20002.1 uroporphyrinogen-III synthase [Cellulomonas fimi]
MTSDGPRTSDEHAGKHALVGLRVLVPRSPERAGPLMDALRHAGAEPIAAPLITIVPPDDVTPLDDAVARLGAGGYDWMSITSAFTVDSLQATALRAGLTLAEVVEAGRVARPGSTLVAAVGDATATTLRRAGVDPDLVPVTEQSARGMLADWPTPEPGSGRAVLVVQGDLAEPALSDGLTELGWLPHVVVSYVNQPASPLPPALIADLAEGRVDAVVLTSGSAARRLVEQLAPGDQAAASLRLAASTVVCCIGPRTAEVAAELGLPDGVVAQYPGPDSIVAALVAATSGPTAGETHTDTDADTSPEVI